MPYNRPGRGVYVTNGSGDVILHDRPVKEGNFVGVAIKQQAPGWDSLAADESEIEDGEQYFLITKGIVQVPEVAGFAKGDPVYIVPATGGTGTPGALTETATGNAKFGRVVEIENERGTPANFVRVDLDAKDSF